MPNGATDRLAIRVEATMPPKNIAVSRSAPRMLIVLRSSERPRSHS